MDTKTQRRVMVAGALLVTWFLVLVVMPGWGHDGNHAPLSTTHHTPSTDAHLPQRYGQGRAKTRSPPGTTRKVAVRATALVVSDDDQRHGTSAAAPDMVGSGGDATGSTVKTRQQLRQPLLPPDVLRLLSDSSMIDVMGDTKLRDACPWSEKESASSVAFAKTFSRIMRNRFPPERGGAPDGSGLHWFLDEGGLIGSGRAGSLANADDDFDFFALLPNQHAPCRVDSLTCTAEEYEKYIHEFLMVFWDEGLCINKFHPDPKKFRKFNTRRMMFSFQLDRRPDVAPDSCFVEGKPFAHMHLGMFTKEGKIKTNMWAHGSTHPMDELDLKLMLPVRRCRAGPVDAPCPNNITGFLTVRNRGEYRNSGDGNCLLVRKKWGMERKKLAVVRTRELAACGYNTMVDLVPSFVASGYQTC
jgi:hypothetical protein